MIRAKKVHVAVQAAYDEYHEKQARQWEQYYAGRDAHLGPDMEVAEGPTMSAGDPAILAELGVGTRPTIEQITALGAGLHPNSGDRLVAVGPGHDRVAYHDFVYSVPKSVSVEFAAARGAGDERRCRELLADVEGAVREGVKRFAELMPLARRGARSALPEYASPVALLNVHSAARPVKGQEAPDPHVHVHMRVLNLAKGADARWSAVNYRVLYHNIRSLNGLIEAELQARLHSRGYATVSTTHGALRPWDSYELERVPAGLREAMSSRQALVEKLATELWEEQVAQLAARLGRPVTGTERALLQPTAEQVQALSRASREQKLPQTRQELAAVWRRITDAGGYRHLGSDDPGSPPSGPAAGAGVAIAEWAMGPTGLTAGQAVWTTEDVLEAIMPLAKASGLDAASVAQIAGDIEARSIRLADRVSPGVVRGGLLGPVWTTAEMRATEREVVDYLATLAREPRLSVPETAIRTALDTEASHGQALDPEQERAMRVLCGTRGWSGVVGVAGAGKTTTCRPAIAALHDAGYDVVGLSMAESATQVLRSQTGVPAWNIKDFLVRHETGNLRLADGRALTIGPRTVLLIDESGTVDSRTAHRLVEVCWASQVAAIRNVGDPGQTQPVGAGGIFGYLARDLPTAYLTVNYRQGDPSESHEAVASRLLREGRGRAYLEAKDRAGLLHVSRTHQESLARAVESWGTAVAGGADPASERFIADLHAVVDPLNAGARDRMEEMGRLGERLQVGEGLAAREFAVGDRVAFAGKHVARLPHLDDAGQPLRRRDGSERTRSVTTPNRTPGTVVAVDREARTLTVRTDSAAHISGRDVVLTAAEVAGEGERGRGRIQHAYATTTATAQGREWDTSHVVLTGSRLAGLEQTYTAQTRANIATHVYIDAESVHAEADPANGRSLRDATLDALAETLVRPTAKVTTLDYASPEARAAIEQRFAAPVRQWQRLDDPATGAQRDLLERMQRSLPAGATWLQASVAIDAAHGNPSGTQSIRWLEETGLSAEDAGRRVGAALAAQAREADQARADVSDARVSACPAELAMARSTSSSEEVARIEAATQRIAARAAATRKEAAQKAAARKAGKVADPGATERDIAELARRHREELLARLRQRGTSHGHSRGPSRGA